MSNMKSLFEVKFQRQLRQWIVDNKRMALKVMDIVTDIERNPTEGIGKPEPLKHNLTGLWSRRIDQEHRLIYEIDEENEVLTFISCFGHYH